MLKIKEELEKLKQNNQYRHIPNIETKTNGKIIIDGVEYINFASNDYLGISTNLNLREEFLKQNHSLMSSASARLLTGSSKEYAELEATVSNLFKKEAALIFNTGYQANLGVISSLVSKGDVVFSDKLNHASIIDGMQLSQGEFFRYKHLDYDNLEKLLFEKRSKYNRAIIVSESVFSMDGDKANIEELIRLKYKYDCLLMIDEAHAFCACGDSLSGITNGKDVDIITATLGKAVGSFGAFCVSKKEIIEYLINKSRPFIFSTSIPPINIAWSNWLLTEKRCLIEDLKQNLSDITEKAHKLLSENNIQTVSKSHIIPIVIGDSATTVEISEKLQSMGYYIPAIRPPTVPKGTSRLRLSLTANTKISDFKNIIKTIF